MLLKDPRNQNPNVVSAFLQLPLVHQAAPRVYYQRLVRTSPFNMACYYTIHILQARLHTILGLHSVLRRGRVASKGCCCFNNTQCSSESVCVSIQIKPVFPHSHTYPHLSAHGYVLIRFFIQLQIRYHLCFDAKISEQPFNCYQVMKKHYGQKKIGDK